MTLPTALTIDDLSKATLEGTGVFDVLMRANKAHLEAEFALGRIKGPEYSSVYLGSLESVLQNSVAFLMGKDKAYMEARLIEQQIINAAAELEVIRVQKLKVEAEVLKINAEVSLTGAQIRLVEKQIEAADDEKAKRAAETALLVDELLTRPLERDNLLAVHAKTVAETNMVVDRLLTESKQRELVDQQILNEIQQVLKSKAEVSLLVDKLLSEAKQRDLMDKQIAKLASDILLVDQQILNEIQQVLKSKAEVALLVDKLLTEAKQRDLMDQQIAKLASDILLSEQQILNEIQQVLKSKAEVALLVDKLLTEAKQRELITGQIAKLVADTLLTTQQIQTEIAQKCKLEAEYDNLMLQKLRIAAETSLIGQKTLTEKAQITGSGVDVDSVIGRQKDLYKNQTEGYIRDAEQKAANIMVDSWKVRRTTDDTGTEADANNMLYDPAIGRAVAKLLNGVGA